MIKVLEVLLYGSRLSINTIKYPTQRTRALKYSQKDFRTYMEKEIVS